MSSVKTLVPFTRNNDDAQPNGKTSTGIANVQTFTPPKGARAMWLSAKTTSARVTIDGGTPDPAAPNGFIVVAGAQPVLVPFVPVSGQDLKFCSDVAGNSELNVVWVE